MGDLTHIDSVKSYLNKDNDTHDALLSMLIAGVSARMEMFMGRIFEEMEHTENIESPGYPALVVDNGPIIRVISVVEGATTLASDDYRIEGRSLVRLSGGVMTTWGQGVTVVVKYEAGYEDVPADIDLACVMQVTREFGMSTAGSGVLGVLRVAANQDTGESYTYEMRSWLREVEQTMKAYRVF
ncbi:hypothetical protein LCGC14_2296270 [marine sediment metagenome]|uniref:Phage gp6-like head-tail connector protein n=1 Tax=marine sediment metagenome TaxID=412755 RepID=A0A0F9FJX5_9ZZZZ